MAPRITKVKALALAALLVLGNGILQVESASAGTVIDLFTDDLSGRYFDFGMTIVFRECWGGLTKNDKSLSLQAKPIGSWITKSRGIVKKDTRICKNPSYPWLVTYKWTVDEMGIVNPNTQETILQMRTVFGKYSSPFTMSVFPTGYVPDYGKAIDDAIKNAARGTY